MNWTIQEEAQRNPSHSPLWHHFRISVTFLKEVSSSNTFVFPLLALIFRTHHYVRVLSLKNKSLNNWLIQKGNTTTLPCSVPIKVLLVLTQIHQYINAHTEKTKLQINTHRDTHRVTLPHISLPGLCRFWLLLLLPFFRRDSREHRWSRYPWEAVLCSWTSFFFVVLGGWT